MISCLKLAELLGYDFILLLRLYIIYAQFPLVLACSKVGLKMESFFAEFSFIEVNFMLEYECCIFCSMNIGWSYLQMPFLKRLLFFLSLFYILDSSLISFWGLRWSLDAIWLNLLWILLGESFLTIFEPLNFFSEGEVSTLVKDIGDLSWLRGVFFIVYGSSMANITVLTSIAFFILLILSYYHSL